MLKMSRRKVDEMSRRPTASGMSVAKRIRADVAPIEKIVTETDERLKGLVEAQTVTDVTLVDVQKRFKSFTESAVFKRSQQDVSGRRSLGEYKRYEQLEEDVQKLRDCNLTEQEIKLWLSYKSGSQIPAKTSNVFVDPEVQEHRIKEIEQRLAAYEERVSRKQNYAAAQLVSRHKMELERALNQGRSEKDKLSSLMMKEADTLDESTPEGQLKIIASELSNRNAPIPKYENPFPNPWVTVVEKVPVHPGFIGPKLKDLDLDVSDEHIYQNRLSVSEIKQLPKFADYSPGEACNTLFVKNLGSTVRQEHIEHLFCRFQIPVDPPIQCKLMSGRMRGQAFVTCADIDTAMQCLNTLNGYKLRGRPLIITYSKSRAKKSRSDDQLATPQKESEVRNTDT